MASKLTQERIEQRQKNLERARDAFTELGGQVVNGFPYIHSEVFHTPNGTPYLKSPGVVMIAKPQVELEGMRQFLAGFGPELRFEQYVDDPDVLEPGAQLVKVSGQVCYASYAPGRTKNVDAAGYIEDIKEQGHGSVLEHPSYSFLIYGVSRSYSHEEVRHRSGKGYSQLSQRYVSGRVLRFVERKEYQKNARLHTRFEDRIDQNLREYEEVAKELQELQDEGSEEILFGEAKTDQRKKVQQTARSVLANEAETVLVDTGNARAWQHTINMRSNDHAETEIREVYFRQYLCFAMVEQILFGDYEVQEYSDGTRGAQSPYRKP